jgi:hypothetical protein
MADIKTIISTVENVYNDNNALNILKDYERVLDELGVYVYENWEDGELVAGPHDQKYFVTCQWMWAEKDMPNPKGGQRLLDYGCKVTFKKDEIKSVRKIKTPADIRPGTKKGKIDLETIWVVEVSIPKKLMFDINKGYRGLDANTKEMSTPTPKIDSADDLIQAPEVPAGAE